MKGQNNLLGEGQEGDWGGGGGRLLGPMGQICFIMSLLHLPILIHLTHVSV